MFDKIKRYRITSYDDGSPAFVDDEGDWVKYEDVKYLLERSDNSEYLKSVQCQKCYYNRWCDRPERHMAMHQCKDFVAE